jgi:uncharacterized protein YggU (UPF0235/DUF167 family)
MKGLLTGLPKYHLAAYGVPRSDVTIVSGSPSSRKRVRIVRGAP